MLELLRNTAEANPVFSGFVLILLTILAFLIPTMIVGLSLKVIAGGLTLAYFWFYRGPLLALVKKLRRQDDSAEPATETAES